MTKVYGFARGIGAVFINGALALGAWGKGAPGIGTALSAGRLAPDAKR